ncbi:MAG: hypothetical protein EXX96DRAFT_654011 [Benjaminiella poitrasii]|nr:MAG: hypothetical protein EXX96DRAFT_654011 [Benjaminiella poitrasii]
MGLEAAKLIQTSRNLDNDSFIELLKRKQKKLIKHAAWKKRNKKRSQQKRKQQLKRNEKWIREIEWKVTISPSNTALRLSQKDSDNVPAESKDEIKLKAKVRELSKKLNKLTELRNLRRKKLESKGHFFAEEGDQFYNLIKELNEQQQQEQNKNETDALNNPENEIKQTFIHKDDVWKNGSIDEIAYNHCPANICRTFTTC